MNALLVAALLIVSTLKVPLVARDRILVSLNASLVAGIDCLAKFLILVDRVLLPTKRQISGRNNLDEVHEVESFLLGLLLRFVQGVDVVVCPSGWARALVRLLDVLNNHIAQLWSKSKVINTVGEGVGRIFEVVLQVMNVKVTVREGLSGSDMEVSNDFVHTDAALKATSLLALCIEMFRIVLTFALLDSLTTAEGPRDGSVGVSDFVASLAAAGLGAIGRGGSAVTFTAVVGGKMGRLILVPEHV